MIVKAHNHPTLFNRRIHNILILIYKGLHGLSPEYISKLFTFRNCNRDLRGIDILSVPRVNTTSYGLHSLSYHGCKLWNSFPNNIRAIPELRNLNWPFVISNLMLTAAPFVVNLIILNILISKLINDFFHILYQYYWYLFIFVIYPWILASYCYLQFEYK